MFKVYFRYNTNGGIYFQKSTGVGSAGIAGPWVDMGAVLPGGSLMDKSVANLWVSDYSLIHLLCIESLVPPRKIFAPAQTCDSRDI